MRRKKVEFKMKTSYYANLKRIDTKKYSPVAISSDEGKMVGFEGRAMRNLSPYSFFRKWKAREIEIDKLWQSKMLSEQEYLAFKEQNEDDYIEKFYNRVLKPLNPQDIYCQLGENAVLLCFEKPTKFCHRFLVAGWLENSLGITIDELGFKQDIKVQQNKQRLKDKLLLVIEENIKKE